MNGTDWVILLAPALLLTWLAYDLAVVWWLRPTRGWPTITSRIQQLSSKYPAIPFVTGLLVGLLCAHLFGQF